jgi:hypothetical protein
MSVDRIIAESLKEKSAEYRVEDYEYEDMFNIIEEQVAERRKNIFTGSIQGIKSITSRFKFKDLLEVAIFILVIIAVPALVSVTRDNFNTAGRNNISAENISYEQAIKQGYFVKVTFPFEGESERGLNRGSDKVYNDTKIDTFISNYNSEKSGSVRIIEYIYKDFNYVVKKISDLSIKDGKIAVVNYDVRSHKSTYKALKPIYYAGIEGTEQKFRRSYTLYESTPYIEGKGVELISFTYEDSNIEGLNSEAGYRYLSKNNYKIIPNSIAGTIVELPDSFSLIYNSVKIGEKVKEYNERSKEFSSLDFSPYLGRKVYAFTALIEDDNNENNQDIIILSIEDRVIGAWYNSLPPGWNDIGVLHNWILPE